MKGWKRSRRLMPKSKCARGSFRYLKRKRGGNPNVRVMICCPRSHWNKKSERCEVGTRAYEILRRK